MPYKVVILRDTSTEPDSNVPVRYVQNADGTYSLSVTAGASDDTGLDVRVVDDEGNAIADDNPFPTDPGAQVIAPHEDADGPDVYRDMAADEVKSSVLSGPGNLYGWKVHNPGAVAASLHLYNAATGDVTVGTTVPYFTIGPIPAGGWDEQYLPMPIVRFATAMTRAATQGGTGGVSGLTASGEATAVTADLKVQLSVKG